MVLAVVGPIVAWVVPRTCRVVVGNDGVLVRRLFESQFHPYRAIGAARREGSALILELEGGRMIPLSVGTPAVPAPGLAAIAEEGAISVDALIARIADAQSRRPSASSEIASALSCGERGVPEWISTVERLLVPTDYRSGSVPRERVWDVLQDATQPITARAGAAVALRVDLAGDERERLRVAKRGCASKELEDVLDAVEQGDDESVQRALASLRA
jgi:hypothetical protein